MAQIYIYSSLDLRESRGSLEDDIEERFGFAVEVTGGGGGSRGWNIDLEFDGDDLPKFTDSLIEFLFGWGVPPDTHFDVWLEQDEKEKVTRYDVYDTSEVVEWMKVTLTFLSKRLKEDAAGWQEVKRELNTKIRELEAGSG